jgi:dihydroorotate dehydrogenase
MVYKKVIRPLLFIKDPEDMHNMATRLLQVVQGSDLLLKASKRAFFWEDERLKVNLFGLSFPNPIGLAAGFDKNAQALKALASLGFGFIEAGTVTPKPQQGNPRPRLFRLPQQEAIVNRMGFNNQGVDVIKERLKSYNLQIPIGVNIGKSRDAKIEESIGDYIYSFNAIHTQADYIVINISSPNTPGLRRLQERSLLDLLVKELVRHKSKPLLVKISPDLTYPQIKDIIQVASDRGIDGIVATNTMPQENGGLSGRPLKNRSTEIIRWIHKNSAIPIIGVGGVFSAQDCFEKIKAGASLVQIYTGLIYEGPFIVKRIKKDLVKLMEQEGYDNIAEAIGSGLK